MKIHATFFIGLSSFLFSILYFNPHFIDEKEESQNLKSVQVGVDSEGAEYSAQAQIKMSDEGSNRKYEPLVQFTTPEGVRKILEGSGTLVDGKTISMDIKTDTGAFKTLVGQFKGKKRHQLPKKHDLLSLSILFVS